MRASHGIKVTQSDQASHLIVVTLNKKASQHVLDNHILEASHLDIVTQHVQASQRMIVNHHPQASHLN